MMTHLIQTLIDSIPTLHLLIASLLLAVIAPIHCEKPNASDEL